ncbi:MAG: flagellar export chaperone FliS [Candidatus Krumholzibacteriia bacterium]
MTYDRNILAYRETDLQTMGKEKLIVLLYRKMIEHLDKAAACAAADRVEMSRRLSLTQRIVAELRGALDHAIGGEIAANLDTLYDYVFSEILEMQVDRDPLHAANCRRVLEPLLTAWSQIPSGTGNRELSSSLPAGTDPAPASGNAAGSDPRPPRNPEQSFSFSA